MAVGTGCRVLSSRDARGVGAAAPRGASAGRPRVPVVSPTKAGERTCRHGHPQARRRPALAGRPGLTAEFGGVCVAPPLRPPGAGRAAPPRDQGRTSQEPGEHRTPSRQGDRRGPGSKPAIRDNPLIWPLDGSFGRQRTSRNAMARNRAVGAITRRVRMRRRRHAAPRGAQIRAEPSNMRRARGNRRSGGAAFQTWAPARHRRAGTACRRNARLDIRRAAGAFAQYLVPGSGRREPCCDARIGDASGAVAARTRPRTVWTSTARHLKAQCRPPRARLRACALRPAIGEAAACTAGARHAGLPPLP